MCMRQRETRALIDVQQMHPVLKCPYWYLKVNLFVSVIKWLSIYFVSDVYKMFDMPANTEAC